MSDTRGILGVVDKPWVEQHGPKNPTFQPLVQGGQPGDVSESMLNFDAEPDYDFYNKMAQEPVQGAMFLPVPTHKDIKRNIFKVYSKIYNGIKSVPNSVSVAFSITFLLLLGKEFVQNLFSFLISIGDVGANFTTTQNPAYMFFPERAPDEEEHMSSDRLDFRTACQVQDSIILEEIKKYDIQSLKRRLFYQDKESFNTELTEFLKDFSEPNPLSENLESFLHNGVATGRGGATTVDHILLSHNFKANRSSGEGAPIYKLLSEIYGSGDTVYADPKIMENINYVLSLNKYNNLLETISNIFILWNYLNKNLYAKIYQMNTTMSASEWRGAEGRKETRWGQGEASKSIISVKLKIPHDLLQHVYSILKRDEYKNLERDLLTLILQNEGNEPLDFEDNSLSQGFHDPQDNTMEINTIFKKYTGQSLLELLAVVLSGGGKKPTKTKPAKKTKPVKKTKPTSKTTKKPKPKGQPKPKGPISKKAKSQSKSKSHVKASFGKKKQIKMGDLIIKYN